jgi:hypothetical protein
MKHGILIALATSTVLLGTATLAEERSDTARPMHMHKSDMDHRSDKDVANEYKDEATQLREKAQSHHELAQLYRGRTPVKGAANYANVVEHCEQLAKYYEQAAKEAEGVAAELAR